MYVAITLLLAIVVGSDLALIFELLGALVIGGVVFLVPAALVYFAQPPEAGLNAPTSRRGRSLTPSRLALSVGFAALGVFTMVSGTAVTIMQRT